MRGNSRVIYLIIRVEPNTYHTPLAALNFKRARELVIEKAGMQDVNLTYKTAQRRINRYGFVALYDRSVAGSAEEAQITGYWSIEKITLYK